MHELVIYERSDGLFDGRIVAANGNTICNSSQGYERRIDALDAFTAFVDLEEVTIRQERNKSHVMIDDGGTVDDSGTVDHSEVFG